MEDTVTLIKKALQLRKELPVLTITDEMLAKKLLENKGNVELTKNQLNNLNKRNFKAVGKFARQMSTLKKMFGDTVSDETLFDKMEKYEGDVELVVDELVWASETAELIVDEDVKSDYDFSAEVFVNDPMYVKQVQLLQSIDNEIERSNKILWYACTYADEKKEQNFMDILERFRGKYIIDWEFQYKDRTYDLLGHLVCPLSANNVKCVRYLLQAEVRNDISEASLDRALNVAVVFQNEKCIKILMSDKYLEENKKLMRDYALRHWKEKSKAELFLHYLKKELSQEKCVETMENLCQVMKTMVNDRKMISCDFFNVCYIYDKPQMWQAMYSKCRELLNISTLYKKPNDWQWLKEYLVHNRDLLLWLDPLEDKEETPQPMRTDSSTNDNAGEQDGNQLIEPIIEPTVVTRTETIENEGKMEETQAIGEMEIKKAQLARLKTLPKIFPEEKKVVEKGHLWLQWHAIKEICDQETSKESKLLQETLLKDINANEFSFKQICEFECNDIINSKYVGDQNKRKLRQDKTKFGLKSTIKEKELAQMSIRGSDHTANAKHIHDFVLYLNQLLTRARNMDEGFQTKMRDIFRECNGCKFISGHVKSYERSKVKAQIEYANEAFPKSAHIVDIIRCSAMFDTIDDMKNGLNHFKKSLIKSNGTFEVMRVKNGFAQKTKTESGS